MTKKKRILSLALALILSLSLSGPAFAAETAAVMKLTKTEGTVSVSKSNGKAVSLRADLRLYNGYNVTTAAKSYAWINLDSAKLLKLDASTSVEVRKNGSKLEVNVKSGSVSFDVSEKLDSGESLNVSTSTMAVGIRGTCGWVRVTDQWESEICLLEGTSQCVVADPVSGQMKSAVLTGGDVARCVVYPQDKPGDKCDILMERQTTGGIPGFVLSELVLDVPLCDKILDDSGLDVLADLAKDAGGDPSGRTPDGKSASPEVLGQAQRVQSREETQTAQKLEEIQKEEEQQESHISKDPVWEEGQQPPSGGGGGGSSGGLYTVTFDYGDGTTETQTTNAGNKLDSLPDGADKFDGDGAFQWFTQAEGDDEVTTDTVFSSNQTVYARWDGSWMFNKTTGHLTIFNDMGMNSRTVNWGPYQNEIKTVEIRSGVTGIGMEAFSGCTNLASVSIPDSVTSIGTRAFSGCASLTGVTIPFGVTSIYSGTFMNCSSLESVTIPNSVETIEMQAFSFCTNLTSVDIPNSVISIADAVFLDCTSLTSIIIPGSVRVIKHEMFSGCSGLTSVTIGEGVTEIEYSAFDKCTRLNDITIPGSVTTIGSNAFRDCDSLKDIYYNDGTRDEWKALNSNVPAGATVHCTNGDTPCFVTFDSQDGSDAVRMSVGNDYRVLYPANPTRTGYIFRGWYKEAACENEWDAYVFVTEDMTLYAKWVTAYTVTFDSQRGSDVASATVGHGGKVTEPANPTKEGYTFDGWYKEAACTTEWNFATDTVTGAMTLYAKWVVTITFNLNDFTLTSGAPDPVTVDIGGKLTSSAIPSLTSSVDNCEFTGWYTDPTGGNRVTTSTVFKSNQTVYAHWSGWTLDEGTLTISGKGDMLYYEYDNAPWHNDAENITAIRFDINSSVTSIGSYAFYDCKNLTSITIPSSVRSIYNRALYSCDNLTSVNIPASVTSIAEDAFGYCIRLTAITVDADNPSFTSVNGVLFSKDMTQLLQYPLAPTAPYTVPDGVNNICPYSFAYCNLTSVTLPSSLTTIDRSAFFFAAITGINIPEGVTTIGANAFGQSNLKTASIPASATNIGNSIFNSNWFLESITVADGNPILCTVDGVLFNKDMTELIYYPMKKTDASYEIPDGVQSIARRAFEHAGSSVYKNKLTSVTIPSSVTNIGSQAFYSNGDLTTINFSGTQAQWNNITIASDSGLSGKTVKFSNGTTATIP